MDRQHPQVMRLAAALAPLDDDALAALANKGLVRRARKDLEKSPPALTAADDQSVTLSVEGCTVVLSAIASQSTCTCASGVCRHILGSILYLKEGTAPAGPVAAISQAPPATGEAAPRAAAVPTAAEPSLADRLAALDEQTLQKWAGKPLVKRAAVVLSRGFEVEEGAMILVRLPAQNITVRLFGPEPREMICTCHAPDACEHKLAAVLAFKGHKSGKPVELPQAMLQSSVGAPRSREEVRESVATLMREIVSLGLSRLSHISAQRLRTLATSAHGVDLPRLERMLKSMADDVALMLSRDARASSAALLIAAARIAALCAALEQPTPAMVGEHRSVYMPVAGAIDVVGLGARRWTAKSGYEGLTLYFWETAAKRWTSWTDARPIGTPGFDPVRRFDEDGPWSGCGSPRDAVTRQWRLSGVHRNGVGRITARANTRGVDAGRSAPLQGPAVTEFKLLGDAARKAFAPGLRERRDHAELALLVPTLWTDAQFDPITQEVRRVVFDAAGVGAALVLRHSPETDQGLSTLQRIDGATVRAVLGTLRLGPSGLFVEPITLWTDDKPIHLTLDNAPHAAATTAAPTPPAADASSADEDEPESEQDSAMAFGSPIGRLLTGVEGELLAIAEGGVEVIRDLGPLRSAAGECAALGLARCATAVQRLCEQLEGVRKKVDRDTDAAAGQLLRAAYLARLTADAAGVCLAIR